MLRLSLAISALVLLGSTAARAADPNGDFAVVGPGARSCAEFRGLVDSSSRDSLLFVAWFQGYLSRTNLQTDNTYSVLPTVDANASATLLYRVCTNNPEASVERAADTLVTLFQPLAVTSMSEIVRIKEGERTLEIWQDTLLKIQQLLKDRGLYSGTVDGLYGPGTRDALVAFQKERKIGETGVPDLDTLAAVLAILRGE